ncbi:MAG: oligosaccharide flippase family protein [Bacteroidetes bacterium]|nr:oligosaccharide flippase family protein [Bacteroidota bacterium]
MSLAITKEIKLLAKHSAVYSLGNFMQRFVALLLLPVYTRFLTPHDYGVKELVGLSADVIGILLATSIAGAFYRFYFQYDTNEDRNEVVSTAFLSIGVVGIFALVPLSFYAKNMARVILDDPSLHHFFLISFVSLWFQSLNSLSYNYLKANKQSLKFIFLSFSKMVLAIALNIYFVCVLRIGVVGILISNLITVIVMSMVVTLPLLCRIGIHFSKFKLFEMLRFGLPLIPSQLGAFIVHLSDRFFLKEYCSIADAGIYSLGYRFGALPGNFISDPFNQIFQPRRLEVYKQKNSEYIFGRIFTYFLLLMLFAGLMVSILTQDLLMIMADKQFWSAYQIVPLIVIATTIFSFHYHLNIGIIISKKTKFLAYINLSNGVVVLILNFLFIPRFGIFGAAWATIFAFVYKAGLTYYFSSKFYKIHFELLRVAKLIIVAGIVYFFCQSLHIQSVYLSFFSKTILVVFCYPIGLFLVKFFSNQEKEKIIYSIQNRTIAGWM